MKPRLPLVGLAIGVSCTPIAPKPISVAPLNTCAVSCEKYGSVEDTIPQCKSDTSRCEGGFGRPDYAFWTVVHAPELATSGLSYVFVADENGDPTFNTVANASELCKPPECLAVTGAADVRSGYTVVKATATALGFPVKDGTSIPVNVVHRPAGDRFSLLPLPTYRASSESIPVLDGTGTSVIATSAGLPFGRYRRTLFPQAPYDAIFPPITDDIDVTVGPLRTDTVILGGDHVVDDLGGTSRDALITRAEGLDGWHAWLADHATQERISVNVPLSGTEAKVTLYTALGTTLGSDVDAIVSPPADWIGVPRLVSFVPGGFGLQNLAYPTLLPPASVSGVVVVEREDGELIGFQSRVSFATADGGTLLRYDTTVETDDKGRFATVLPRGSYIATVEPAEGTGYARVQLPAEVDRDQAAFIFKPAPRTLVTGRAVLTDGRALSEAELLALPERKPSTTPTPRPAQTTTDVDGRFRIALDQGSYVLSIVPKEGTGFPRVVVRQDIAGSTTELPDFRVPPPRRFSFKLRAHDNSRLIARAIVRAFTIPGSRDGTSAAAPVEIGNAMSDDNGNVEILLAEQPQ